MEQDRKKKIGSIGAFCLLIIAIGGLIFAFERIRSLSTKKSKLSPPSVVSPASFNNTPIKTSTPPSTPQDPNSPLASNMLARAGNWTLTIEDFKERLKNLKEIIPDFDVKDLESKKLVLEELIRQQLLVMDAREKGLDNKKEIAEAVEEFKRTLLVREVANKLIEGVSATEQEAQDYYNQNKEIFVESAEWHIREIVVPTQQEAKDILIEILKGADFAETAKTHSKSKSASQGGDLGFLKELPAPYASAVATLNAGDISSVFKGPEGYCVVKLEEKRGGEPLEFPDVKADIITGLTQLKQQQAILGHIEQLRQKTPVQVNEGLLNF